MTEGQRRDQREETVASACRRRARKVAGQDRKTPRVRHPRGTSAGWEQACSQSPAARRRNRAEAAACCRLKPVPRCIQRARTWRLKSEDRRPTAERRPKLEVRNPLGHEPGPVPVGRPHSGQTATQHFQSTRAVQTAWDGGLRVSDFGLSFGLRISAFGLGCRIPRLPGRVSRAGQWPWSQSGYPSSHQYAGGCGSGWPRPRGARHNSQRKAP